MTTIDLVPDAVLDVSASGATISPSSLGVFFALDQCQRFLRLALMPQDDRDRALRDADVIAEQIPPSAGIEGRRFERQVEDALRLTGFVPRLHPTPVVDDDAKGIDQHAPDLVRKLTRLEADRPTVFGQHKIVCALDGWQIGGQPDIVVATRGDDGSLTLLVCDVKASHEPRLEHRLQVALYARMLRKELPGVVIEQGVIYRPPAIEPKGAALLQVEADRGSAQARLQVDCALLSIAEDTASFDGMLDRILLRPDSVARTVLGQKLETLPFHVERKCDVCAYNQLCLKQCRTTEDLSLVPYLDVQDKQTLGQHGVTTVTQLATLGERMAEVRAELRETWKLGSRLDELSERAASYLKWQRADIVADDRLSERGYSTLPPVTGTHHPNLIQIFLDVQTFDVEERVYLLGALVRGHANGKPAPNGTRRIVKMSPVVPGSEAEERTLLTDWLKEVLEAIRIVARPEEKDSGKLAPIHLYVFEQSTQQRLLAVVQRHADAVFGVESLFRLLMQRAAFDTGNVSVVATEVERQWNLPMLCQSLQAVASFRGFDWNAERPLRSMFRHRLFDQLGVETQDDQPLFSPKRSRFTSDIPIEYPFLVWKRDDPEVVARQGFTAYGQPSAEDIEALESRRLDALAHVVDLLRANVQSTKTPFDISALLSAATMRASNSIEAMRNFVVVERHVELNGWRSARFLPPERRVLTGDTLIVHYAEANQDIEVRKELRVSRELFEKEVSDWKAAKAAAAERKGFEPSWKPPEVTVKLELRGVDLPVEPAKAVRRSSLKQGTNVVIFPRWDVDSRLPADEQVPYTPTAKQLMRGSRGRISKMYSADGRWWIDVELSEGQFGPEGFVFKSSLARPLVDGDAHTLDEDPTSWGEAHRLNVLGEVDECNGKFEHPFARWIDGGDSLRRSWPAEAADGQGRLRDGMRSVLGIELEAEKAAYIGGHGDDPVLLVQGPPGTGKSFASAFAILARMQGAMVAGIPCRVAVSCSTHAAVDVLLAKIVEEQTKLSLVHQRDPEACASAFDPRILEVPVLRYLGGFDLKEGKQPPDGCFALAGKDGQRVNQLMAHRYVVVGGTPSAIRKLGKQAANVKKHGAIWDVCIIDEASQMTAPDALQATFGLKPDGQVIFVGDHRQMPPVVKHAWDQEAEVSFDPYAMHRSIFDLIRLDRPTTPTERFARSFRLHRDVAEYLRREIYRHDQIAFHSELSPPYTSRVNATPLVEAVLNSGRPMIVIVHDEASSQVRNEFEQHLIAELYKGFEGRRLSRHDTETTYGVVVPHRAQRADLRERLVQVTGRDAVADDVDTVERFQGGEREVIIVSATESDPAYLRVAGAFLFDPRRLTVAISRAKQMLIVIASRSVFEFLPPDLEMLRDTSLWRNLLHDACGISLWDGELYGHRVRVFGNDPLSRPDILG